MAILIGLSQRSSDQVYFGFIQKEIKPVSISLTSPYRECD